MIKRIRYLSFLLVFLSSVESFAQEGSADFPSLTIASIYLRNATGGPVVFYIESAGTDRTEFHLGPSEAATYTGADGDTWMNVIVKSAGGEHVYGINVGERNYFSWTGNDLRLFKLGK